MTYSSQGHSSPGETQKGGAQLLTPDGKPVSSEQSYAKAAEAFDAGLAFVWNHRRRLLQGGFIAGLIEIALTYSQYFFRLTQQQVFLVLICGVGATAWMMTYAGLFCLNVFKKTETTPPRLALKALQSMPKVVLSYIVLVAIAMALFSFPPLLIFAIFGIWAPAFCVAELFALPLKEVEESPDDAFDEDVMFRKVIRFRFFQGRPLWDLGFARSIAFVGQNFGLSLQFSLFAWAVAVIPAGVMLSLAGYYPSFSSLMLEILGANLLQVMLLGVGMVSFLLLLPQDARAELGLPNAEDLMAGISRTSVPEVLKIQNKKYPLLVVICLGMFSTMMTWTWVQHQHTMPTSVQVSLEGAQVTKDRMIITLQLADNEQLFRWLDTNSLRLEIKEPSAEKVAAVPAVPAGEKSSLVPTEGAAEPASPVTPTLGEAVISQAVKSASDTPASPADATKPKEPKLIEPERVMPFGVDGTPLDEQNFTPYSRPLRLVLYFARPKETSGKFALYHSSMFGLGTPILEGEFSPSGSGSDGAGGKDGKPT